MRVAQHWQDYELIDATDGFRLERWGDILLKRPDPQVIWQDKQHSPLWGKLHAEYIRSSKGGGAWQTHLPLPQRWNISYGQLKFIVSPTGFKHTGLFPEQATNWDVYTSLITAAKRPIKVLNLFGYTGAATLACAAAGAQVVHVDASRGMLAWAQENAKASALAQKPIRWLVDDCQKFTQRELRRGNSYDAIIMDPPSYGRGPGGEVWKLEEAIWPFLKEAVALLSENPLFFALNAYTSGLAPGVGAYMLQRLIQSVRGGSVSCDEIGLQIVATQGLLPCGNTTLWQA